MHLLKIKIYTLILGKALFSFFIWISFFIPNTAKEAAFDDYALTI